MKDLEGMSPEEFVKWLHKKITVSGGGVPSEEEWKVVLKNLDEAARWLHPWYLKNSDDGDDGGGENQIPHTSIHWKRQGNMNIPVIH